MTMKYLLAFLLIASTAQAELWQLPGGQVQDLDQRRDWSQKFPGAIKVGWYQPNAQTAPTIVPVAQSNLTPAQAAAWFSAKQAADVAAEVAKRQAIKDKYAPIWTNVKTVLNNNGFTITTPQSFVDAYPDIVEWVATTGSLTAAQKTQALARLPALYLAIQSALVE
jgi:hypothetical protein